MYQNHPEFLEWAASYDTGDVNMRSKAKHDEWQKLLSCKRIVMDGAGDLDANFQCVKRELDRKESAPVMPYYRVHTSDIAYMTQQPRGIFTAVWKLVENRLSRKRKRRNTGRTESISRKSFRFRHFTSRAIPITRPHGSRTQKQETTSGSR